MGLFTMDNELTARMDRLEAILVAVLHELTELKTTPTTVNKDGHHLVQTHKGTIGQGDTLTVQAETRIEEFEVNIWTHPKYFDKDGIEVTL